MRSFLGRLSVALIAGMVFATSGLAQKPTAIAVASYLDAANQLNEAVGQEVIP